MLQGNINLGHYCPAISITISLLELRQDNLIETTFEDRICLKIVLGHVFNKCHLSKATPHVSNCTNDYPEDVYSTARRNVETKTSKEIMVHEEFEQFTEHNWKLHQR